MSRAKQSQAKIRNYRSLYAKAKRAGLVKGDKDARSLKPSSYMKTKLNKLAPYLQGDYESVKVPPKTAKAFRKAQIDAVPVVANGRALVKKKSGWKTKVKSGNITQVMPLKKGAHEEVILPFSFETLQELIDNSADIKEQLDRDYLQSDNELWAFKIYGWPSIGMFSTFELMLQSLSLYTDIDESENEYSEGNKRLAIFRTHIDNWNFDQERQERFERNRQKRRDDWFKNLSPQRRAKIEERAKLRRKRNEYSYSRELERNREYKERKRKDPDYLAKEAAKARERYARLKAEREGK